MAKSAEAFRTISEVADWLELETHVLRFWESKFPQVKPVRLAGGRRYYRPKDMLVLGGVKKLLREDGMTIRGVQNVLKKNGMSYVADLSPPLNGLETSTAIASENDIDAQSHELLGQGQTERIQEIEFATPDASLDRGITINNVMSRSDSGDQLELKDTQAEVTASEVLPRHEAQERVEDSIAGRLNSDLSDSRTLIINDDQQSDEHLMCQEDNSSQEKLSDTLFTGKLLRNLSEIKVLTRRQSRELSPLIGRLAVLRDKLMNDSG